MGPGSVDTFPCKFEARALPLRHERKSHVAVWPFEAYSTDLIHREGRAGRPIDANHEQLSIEGIATSIGGEGPLRGLALNIATTVSDGDDHPIGLVENYAHRILTKGWLQFIAGFVEGARVSTCPVNLSWKLQLSIRNDTHRGKWLNRAIPPMSHKITFATLGWPSPSHRRRKLRGDGPACASTTLVPKPADP